MLQQKKKTGNSFFFCDFFPIIKKNNRRHSTGHSFHEAIPEYFLQRLHENDVNCELHRLQKKKNHQQKIPIKKLYFKRIRHITPYLVSKKMSRAFWEHLRNYVNAVTCGGGGASFLFLKFQKERKKKRHIREGWGENSDVDASHNFWNVPLFEFVIFISIFLVSGVFCWFNKIYSKSCRWNCSIFHANTGFFFFFFFGATINKTERFSQSVKFWCYGSLLFLHECFFA